MKKILHLGKYYYPDLGGIESVTSSLAKGSVELGYEVIVICFNKGSNSNKEIIEGVNVFRSKILKTIFSQPISFEYFKYFLAYSKDADVIHLHAPNILASLFLILVNSKSKVVVHWHSDVVNKGLIGKLFRPLELFLLKKADRILATSELYANSSNQLKGFKNKTAVVPIGIQDRSKLVSGTKLPIFIEKQILNKKIILAVGRLVPYKGFDILVKAAKEISNDAVIVIVGKGSEKTNLENLIHDLDLQSKVLLVGGLNEVHLNSLYQKATLFCLPSIYRSEAFGVVLLEAMSYSLPIVASNIPGSGVSWVNQHNITGLNVNVGNFQELAKACNAILNSNELRNEFSKNARKRFESEFDENVSIDKVNRIYKELTSI